MKRPTFDTGGFVDSHFGAKAELAPVVATKHEELPIFCEDRENLLKGAL